MNNWQSTTNAPEGQSVMTRIDDGRGVRNEAVLIRQGNLWFSGEMYMYYTPTHWRPLTQVESLRKQNTRHYKLTKDRAGGSRMRGHEAPTFYKF